MSKVKITLTRSPINRKSEHKKTVRALGLRKMHQSKVHELSPSVKGMIDKVSFMLKIEEVSE